jgi:hypothetical protein
LAPGAAHADPPKPPAAPAGTTLLFSVNDAQTSGVLIQWKFGSPFNAAGTYGWTPFFFPGGPWPHGGQVPPEIEQLRASTLAVTKHMCHVRHFCGRHGGNGPFYSAFSVTGKAKKTRFAAESGTAKRLYIEARDSGAEDIVAHEFGHLMDKGTYAAAVRDTKQDLQGDEVEEALADMFAYDYDRDDAQIGENRVGQDAHGFRDWQNPGSLTGNHDKDASTSRIPYPSTMAQYRCDAKDTHFNSTILSHGYWLFVDRVGHDVAGDVLHHVPARLSARPRYIEVMRAFKHVAGERYGATASQAAVDAFKNGVGIGLEDPAGC